MRPHAARAALLILPLATGAFAPVAPLGVASWAPPLLVLAGLLMLAVELFVIPGFGVAGLIALLAMVAGVVLAVMGPFPGSADVLVATAALVSSLTMMGVAAWAVAARLRAGHPLLGGILGRDEYRASVPRPELEGAEGVAVTDLRPAGTIEIAGERLDVVAEAGWVAAGTPVRVLHSEGWRLVVQPVPLLADGAEAPEPRHPGDAPA